MRKLQAAVLISYDSQDQDRFGLEFTMKLRSKGLTLEVCPGASLVDRIFYEGMKNIQAVIVIISKFSVVESWLREGLNASVVKIITDKSKLIPVVIDGVRVPESLQANISKIENLNNYEKELNGIVDAINVQNKKLSPGSTSYSQTIFNDIPGLTRSESLIMKTICDKAIDIGNMWISGPDLTKVSETVRAYGISGQEFRDTLKTLNKRGFLKLLVAYDSDTSLQITTDGFEKYARSYVEKYNFTVDKVISNIVNEGLMNSRSISFHINQKQFIVDHILRLQAKRGLIRSTEVAGGAIFIDKVSPDLRQIFRAV